MHPAPRPAARCAFAIAALVVLVVPVAGAQDRECTPRRPRVERLAIEGNRSIGDDSLRAILFHERAGRLRRWFGFNVGAMACLDSTELKRDVERIAYWYSLRGYPGTVATVTTRATGDRTTHVRFEVREARPIRLTTVRVDSLPPGVINVGALITALRGNPLDDTLVVRAADSVQAVLRSVGYPRARPPTIVITRDTTERRAEVGLTFHPNALVRVSRVEVAMTANDSTDPALDEGDIRDLLRVKPGDVYTTRAVGESQQLLFGSGIYRTVAIDTLPNGAGDSIPVRVRLVEGRHSSLRAGGGWGTLDCFRLQARYIHQNFLGRAHRLQLDGRLSKIGVGAPLDGFDALCAPGVKADSFSTRLNYYAGTTMQMRGVLGERWHPQLTLFSERRTEFGSYIRETTIGALASLERPLIPRVSTVFTYRFDNGRTISDQAVACGTFGLCRFNDQVLLISPSQTHAAGVTFSRSAPSLGTLVENDARWALESRLGTVYLGVPDQRVNFNRTQLEYALYRPLSRWLIGAARVQAGAVVTRRDLEPLVPPQERFYSGGQNTVRGFGQNQLGPAVYIVGAPDTTLIRGGFEVGEVYPSNGFQRLAPAGGTATALLNLELRTRRGWPTELLRWVVFLDAGRVWNNTGNYSVSGLRVTPGAGFRLITPLGPFRVDVGYNAFGYDAGPAFHVVPATAGTLGRAICVAPGTLEPLDATESATLGPVPCPASFRPPKAWGLSRLAFHFSIGEAF